MRVIVTGGAGFIGSHIVEALVEEQHDVIVVDNLSSGKRHYLPKDVRLYPIDILDEQALGEVFDKERPDYVIHHAAQVSVPYSMTHPEKDAQVNIIGTVMLLKYCVEYEVKKIIFASSAAVYGIPHYLPIDEQHPIQPISFYGLSKYTAEVYIQRFARQHDLNYTILRYANVYGMRQDAHGEAGVISIFIDRLLQRDAPLIYGNGSQTRDFVFVKDVARANVQALRHGDQGVFNIGCQIQTSINELVKLLGELQNMDVKAMYQSARPGDIEHSCLAINKAQQHLHWSPQYSLRAGLQETVSYFLQRKERQEKKKWV